MTTTNSQGAQVTPNAPQDSNSQPAPVVTPVVDAKAPEQSAAPATPAATEVKADNTQEQPKPAQQSPVVPDAYNLKLQEGSLLDPAYIAEISTYAKEKKLSNEQAQELLNREDSAIQRFHQSQQEMLVQKSQEWKQQVTADKELGGENLNQNVELAHRALNKFGSEAFKQELDKSGFGNHPEVVRFMSRIGRAMAEDKIIGSGEPPQQKKSMEEIFYGEKK